MISTKGKISQENTGKSSPAKPPPPEAAKKKEKPGRTRKIKTRLKKAELREFRTLLLIKRAETIGLISSMEAEALRSDDGDLSHSPLHMADAGSDAYDQAFTLGMAESERELIIDIDSALQRIEDGTYGVCMMTGKHIPKARLRAKPWAKYTIAAARMIEDGQTG